MSRYNHFKKIMYTKSALNKSENNSQTKKDFFSFDNKVGIGILWFACISFLILQDYYVGTQIFKLETGSFIENFLFRLQNINFIIMVSLLPFVFTGVIFYLANFGNHIAKFIEEIYLDKKFTTKKQTVIKVSVIVLLLFLVVAMPFYFRFIDYFQNNRLIHFMSSSAFFIMFFLTFLYSIIIGLYNFLPPIKWFGISLPIYISTYFGIIVGIAIINNFLDVAVTLFLMLILYFISSNGYSNQEIKKKNNLSNVKKKIIVFTVFITFLIGITFMNFSVWTQEKLKAAPSIGILNKEFLVKNLTKIKIDDSFELLDNNLTYIPKSDNNISVYYLPISLEMRWYFVDNKPDSNNSQITIYGIKEVGSDSNITHSLKFVTTYDVNVTT